MKDNFDEIIQLAKFIIEEAETYKEDEAPYITKTRINWIRCHALELADIIKDIIADIEVTE